MDVFIFFRGKLHRIKWEEWNGEDHILEEYCVKLLQGHEVTEKGEMPVVVLGSECQIELSEYKVVRKIKLHGV